MPCEWLDICFQNTEIDWIAKVDGPQIKTLDVLKRELSINWSSRSNLYSPKKWTVALTSKWYSLDEMVSLFKTSVPITLMEHRSDWRKFRHGAEFLNVQNQGPWLRPWRSGFLITDFRKKKTHVEYLKMIACKDNPTDHLNRTWKFDQSSIPKWSDVVNQKRTREGHEPTVLMSVWLNNYIQYIIYCKLIIE